MRTLFMVSAVLSGIIAAPLSPVFNMSPYFEQYNQEIGGSPDPGALFPFPSNVLDAVAKTEGKFSQLGY